MAPTMVGHLSIKQNAAVLRRFLCLISTGLWLAGCEQAAQIAADCDTESTPVAVIQGQGSTSSLLGQAIMTTGVVTHVESAGFFLQSIADDGDPMTSEALWVTSDTLPELGNQLSVAGQIDEVPVDSSQQTVTAMLNASWQVCATAVPLPALTAEQFVPSEPLENMRLTVPEGWRVADLYQFEDKRVRIARERLFIPTQVVSAGQPAAQLRARNQARSVWLDWSAASGAATWLRARDQLQSNTGILDLRSGQSRLLITTLPVVTTAAEVPAAPRRDSQAQLRIVSINAENLFNGDGGEGGFPTPRGAETAQEYAQQQSRLVTAIDAMQPDIVGLMELENDGYADTGTIAQLTAALDNLPEQNWAFVTAPDGRVGSDVIAVGIVFRSDRVSASGEPAVLTQAPFDQLSRAPLAQRFTVPDSDLSLLVAVNHFKSKGSCPEQGPDSDQGDGQGCWNAARQRSAEQLSGWVEQLQNDWNEPNGLIIGDLNSYRMESPIRVLIQNGWADVAGQFLEPPLYTYRYRGEIGTLDYIFASAELLPRVANADIWHINADAPPQEKAAANATGIARFSDHDPVIVDIKLPQ